MLDAETRSELRRQIDAARRAKAQPPKCLWGDDRRGGSHAGYSNGCRCRACRDAHAAYKRERRALLRELEPMEGTEV